MEDMPAAELHASFRVELTRVTYGAEFSRARKSRILRKASRVEAGHAVLFFFTKDTVASVTARLFPPASMDARFSILRLNCVVSLVSRADSIEFNLIKDRQLNFCSIPSTCIN